MKGRCYKSRARGRPRSKVKALLREDEVKRVTQSSPLPSPNPRIINHAQTTMTRLNTRDKSPQSDLRSQSSTSSRPP